MKAVILRAFGGPEMLVPAELPQPSPGPNELLVRVKATSVNPVDCKIRHDGKWAGIKPPSIIGYDVSGTIEAAGAAVRGFEPGEDIYYTPDIFAGSGSYAQYHVVDHRIVARKPAHLTHFEAAALPLAGGTAWDALIRRAGLHVGQTVLIHAGAGGVGSLAVQIAKAAGARVIATAGAKNHDLVRGLGADVVIDYRAQDFVLETLKATNGSGVNITFDTVGGETLERSVQVTRPHGHLVSIVGNQGALDPAHLRNLTLHFLFSERNRPKLEMLKVLVDRHQLKPVIDCVMPLSQIADAHRRLEAGGVRGKIVLDPDA